MKSLRPLTVSLGILVVTLSGCTTFRSAVGPRPWPWPGFEQFAYNQTVEGPTSLIEENFEAIDLALLLDPTIKTPTALEAQTDPEKYALRLQTALQAFKKNTDNAEQDRNALQDHIIAASNQRCGRYKQFLKRYDAQTNLILGGLAIATAGIGAIFTPADTVRALSGTSSILGGLQAETNEDVFQRQTVQILTDGFEAKRREIYQGILDKREGADLTDYTAERAIGDAIRYHENCSLVAGLEYAALAITRVEGAGLEAFERVARQNRRGQEALGAITGLSAGKQLFPLSAFERAESAQKDLKDGDSKLKAAELYLDPKGGDSERVKTLKLALKKDLSTLQKTITNALSDAEKTLSDNEKTQAKQSQDNLSQLVEKIRNSKDSAERTKLEKEFATELQSAEEMVRKYENLEEKLRRRIEKNTVLLERISELENQS